MEGQKSNQNERGWQLISQNDFKWVINKEDNIIDVNNAWLEFVRFGAATLKREQVIGRSVFDFIQGDEVRTLYKVLIEKVRKTQEAVVIPYRCDIPQIRRFIEMTISPDGENIAFIGRVVRTEQTDTISLFDLTAVNRSTKNIDCCSFCQKVKVGKDWFEVIEAVITLELFNQKNLPKIVFSLCNDCQNTLDNKKSSS